MRRPMSDHEPLRRSEPTNLTPLRGGRDLPHNLDAEQAVLGALLIDDNAFELVAPVLKSEDFYVLAHQHVFTACVELTQEGKTVDPVLLSQRLDAKQLLGHAVPHEMPFGLARGLGTAANVIHYANVVADLAR